MILSNIGSAIHTKMSHSHLQTECIQDEKGGGKYSSSLKSTFSQFNGSFSTYGHYIFLQLKKTIKDVQS